MLENQKGLEKQMSKDQGRIYLLLNKCNIQTNRIMVMCVAYVM